MILPESWRFLGSWWWVLHVVAMVLIFYLGYVIGKASAEDSPKAEEEKDAEKSEKW